MVLWTTRAFEATAMHGGRLLPVDSVGAACEPVRGWFRSAARSRNKVVMITAVTDRRIAPMCDECQLGLAADVTFKGKRFGTPGLAEYIVPTRRASGTCLSMRT